MTLESCVITEKKPLLSVKEAQQKIHDAIAPINESEILPLKLALKRVLADDVFAKINLPTERNSAMDGYALRSCDLNLTEKTVLKNVGISWAGKPFTGELKTGECVRIFTGAVLPENADSVVMQENVDVDGENVCFFVETQTKQNVREIGEDVKQGDLLCASGKEISAADLGLFAAAEISQVCVNRCLNIIFFSTGDELVALDSTLKSGQIYDSNRYLLAGLLEDKKHNVVDGGVIPDDKNLLEKTLVEASKNYDVIITTGGASVGEADFVKEILARCGEVNFWKIAMKPGKPLAFGKMGNCYFFGLPGNPIAVAATFEIIVKPALTKLAGANFKSVWKIKAICETSLKKSAGRQEYQRGILSQDEAGNFSVISAGRQGSNILSAMSKANCYIVLSADCAGVQMGETVTVILNAN
jgi:molybdopterin molybdotransferase